MAVRGIKMDTCPSCGATIAKNLAERIRKNEEGYICPGTSTKQESRKEFEENWKKDLSDGSADYLEWVAEGVPSA